MPIPQTSGIGIPALLEIDIEGLRGIPNTQQLNFAQQVNHSRKANSSPTFQNKNKK